MWLIWCDIPVSHSWAKMSTGYTRISLSSRFNETHINNSNRSYKHICDHAAAWTQIRATHLHAQMFHCLAIMIDDLLFCCGCLCSFSSPPSDGQKRSMSINPVWLMQTAVYSTYLGVWVCWPKSLCVQYAAYPLHFSLSLGWEYNDKAYTYVWFKLVTMTKQCIQHIHAYCVRVLVGACMCGSWFKQKYLLLYRKGVWGSQNIAHPSCLGQSMSCDLCP